MANQVIPFLNVNNVEKSIAAYQALGFKATNQYKDETGSVTYADLDLGGAPISVGAMASNDEREFQEWVKGGPLGTGVLIMFAVKDIDAVHERATRTGWVVEQVPTTEEWGRFLTLNDPDGYVISFWQRPSTRRTTTKKRRTTSARGRAKTKARTSRGKSKTTRRKTRR